MKSMIKYKNTSVSDLDAVFLGWQETLSGEDIALYNITAESHPSYGSTVTDGILRDLNLQIPKRHRNRGNRKNFDTQKKRKRGGE
jgi:hypothetical protein